MQFSPESYRKIIEASARGRETLRQNAQKMREEYEKNPKKCEFCAKPIPFKDRLVNKYCSRYCRAKAVNPVRKAKNLKEVKSCRNCGVPTKNPKFCSTVCSAAFSRFDIAAWLRNDIDGSCVQGCSKAIKTYLIEESGNKCSKCGWSEIHPITLKVPLEINHIDGDSKNNKRENLEVLCPNCHSLTPNFRALNKKSSRKYRSRGDRD